MRARVAAMSGEGLGKVRLEGGRVGDATGALRGGGGWWTFSWKRWGGKELSGGGWCRGICWGVGGRGLGMGVGARGVEHQGWFGGEPQLCWLEGSSVVSGWPSVVTMVTW